MADNPRTNNRRSKFRRAGKDFFSGLAGDPVENTGDRQLSQLLGAPSIAPNLKRLKPGESPQDGDVAITEIADLVGAQQRESFSSVVIRRQQAGVKPNQVEITDDIIKSDPTLSRINKTTNLKGKTMTLSQLVDLRRIRQSTDKLSKLRLILGATTGFNGATMQATNPEVFQALSGELAGLMSGVFGIKLSEKEVAEKLKTAQQGPAGQAKRGALPGLTIK